MRVDTQPGTTSCPSNCLTSFCFGIMLISGLLALMRGFTREVLVACRLGRRRRRRLLRHQAAIPARHRHALCRQAILAQIAVGAVAFLVTLIVVSHHHREDFRHGRRLRGRRLRPHAGLHLRPGARLRARGRCLSCSIGWLLPFDKQEDWVRNATSLPAIKTRGRNPARLHAARYCRNPEQYGAHEKSRWPGRHRQRRTRCRKAANRLPVRRNPGPRQSHRRHAAATTQQPAIRTKHRPMTRPRSSILDGDRCARNAASSASIGHPDAAALTALGLHALQHRGQEAAGIVSFDGERFHSERRIGLVGDTFSSREDHRPPARHARHRPRPLFHHRRNHPAQRAAAVRRTRRPAASPSPTTATSPMA